MIGCFRELDFCLFQFIVAAVALRYLALELCENRGVFRAGFDGELDVFSLGADGLFIVSGIGQRLGQTSIGDRHSNSVAESFFRFETAVEPAHGAALLAELVVDSAQGIGDLREQTGIVAE